METTTGTEGAPTAPETSITTSAAPNEAAFTHSDGTFAEGWTARLPEELGEYRNGLGKFKNVGDLVRSYHGLETRLGRAATAVMVPGEQATPEEVQAYRKAIGVPESADKYDIRPAQLPEGLEWHDEQVKGVLDIAHRHNVPESAMKDLMGWHLQRETMRMQVIQQEAQRQLQAGEHNLRKTWGDHFDAKLSKAAQTAKLAGVDPRSPGFTDPEVVKAITKLGEMLSDDRFVEGGGATFHQGGAAAAKDIMTNKNNPLYEKYQRGDEETVQRVRSLMQ